MKFSRSVPSRSSTLLTFVLLTPSVALAQEGAWEDASATEAPASEAPAPEAPPVEDASATEPSAEEPPVQEQPAAPPPQEAVAEYPPAEPEQPPPEEPVEPAAAAAAAAPPPKEAPPSEPPPAEQAGDPLAAAERAEAEDKATQDDEEFWGMYITGNAFFSFGLGSTHGWNEDCPNVPGFWTPTCGTTSPLGVGGEGRLGVRISFIGLEGFLMGMGDWTSASLDGLPLGIPPDAVPPIAQGMQIGRVGGAIGGGVRFTTLPAMAQISAGVGGGLLLRYVFTSVSSLDGSSTGYTAPMMRADITATFFEFLNVGVIGWAEFSKDVVIQPDLTSVPGLDPDYADQIGAALGDVTVFQGTQFFIGPFLGITFGG